MKNKEEFLQQASALWDKVHQLENSCDDLYSFEAGFEQEINKFNHQIIQGTLGSNKRDRREKKKSRHDLGKYP
jgi:hypothetical protein